MTEKTTIIDQYDEAAVKKTVADALELAAETISAGGDFAKLVTPADATPDFLEGVETSATAIRHIAASYANGARTIDQITADARKRLDEFKSKSVDEKKRAAGDQVVKALEKALKAEGITLDITGTGLVDKLVPDGEAPQSVIERVFARAMETAPYKVTPLFFGRSEHGNAFGLYESEDQTKFPVLVACAGDAHIVGATATFFDRAAAEAYIAADFDAAFLPLNDPLRPTAKRTIN